MYFISVVFDCKIVTVLELYNQPVILVNALFFPFYISV